MTTSVLASSSHGTFDASYAQFFFQDTHIHLYMHTDTAHPVEQTRLISFRPSGVLSGHNPCFTVAYHGCSHAGIKESGLSF